ncbi:MAG: hypothetical protein J2P31_19515, partial [Blastocatellia bacterium]|nr:hypothetical protein [Blastocatellia bacterium]
MIASARALVGWMQSLASRVQSNHRIGVRARTSLLRRKYTALIDPGLRALIHVLCIWLKHEALAWTESPYIDQCSVPFRQ